MYFVLQNKRIQLENPEREVEQVLDAQIDEIVASHMRCCWAVAVKVWSLHQVVKRMALESSLVCFLGHYFLDGPRQPRAF